MTGAASYEVVGCSDSGKTVIVDLLDNGRRIATMDEEHAAMIVRAVNAHDALVEACEMSESALMANGGSGHAWNVEALRLIRAALSLAKGGAAP